MRPLSLFRLRIRVSLDQLVTLVVTVIAAILVIGYQVLRLRDRSSDDRSHGST